MLHGVKWGGVHRCTICTESEMLSPHCRSKPSPTAGSRHCPCARWLQACCSGGCEAWIFIFGGCLGVCCSQQQGGAKSSNPVVGRCLCRQVHE